MGVKEESLPVRLLFGFAGRVRPLQRKGGKCEVCARTVWIDAPPKPSRVYGLNKVIHYSCETVYGKMVTVKVMHPPPYPIAGAWFRGHKKAEVFL